MEVHHIKNLLIVRQLAIHAERATSCYDISVCLSVRPSVRLSNASTVSKQMDISLKFFDSLARA